jgi:hypothetical protein
MLMLITKPEKQKLIEMSQISLWLDSYDDIFTDFDSRNYDNRALSQDFLAEAKRSSRDKEFGAIELRLLVPNAKRNSAHEKLILKRLREHFNKHYLRIKKEVQTIIRQGLVFVILGVICMFYAAFVLFADSKTLLASFMIILLEPASWFFFWEGLDMLLFQPKSVHPDLDFYHKMSKCEISFLPY